jgi:hypothetical protein
MSSTKSLLDYFFSLGDKVTQGDPKRLLDWNFYLMTIMFLAFFSILVGNLIDFYKYLKLANLGWAFVMVAILWFQYQGLKQTYDARKMYKNLKPEVLETEKDMLKDFDSPQSPEEDKKEIESLSSSVDNLSEETKINFDEELKGGRDER